MVFYKTRNPILQKYMEGYYFISEDKKNNVIRYKTFPNNYSILSVSHRADVVYGENKITVVPSATKEISTDIVLRYSNPIEVVYAKAVDEVTFYFKPLGLNHFVADCDLMTRNKSLMDFVVFPDFNGKMLEIFGMKDRERQIVEIEDYWLSKIQVKDFSLMEKILCDVETSALKIDEVAKKYGFTRQYINKLFSKHIGKSPAEYRKIHRFRSSLKKSGETKSLTALSHNHLFYDQSHFNKSFRDLTGSNPSFFFKNVDTDRENVWLFI